MKFRAAGSGWVSSTLNSWFFSGEWHKHKNRHASNDKTSTVNTESKIQSSKCSPSSSLSNESALHLVTESSTSSNFSNNSKILCSSSSKVADTERFWAHRNISLLVVDDSILNCKMITKQLTCLNFSLRTAHDGDEAVEKMNKLLIELSDILADPVPQPVDCILMDFNMKRMNGPEATKLIRDMGFDGVIIGMTANAYDVDFEIENDHFIEMGADAIIPKPFNPTAFSAMVQGMTSTIVNLCFQNYLLLY